MFLFILESIGTSELLLIGIVALIFLGPRRLPEIARKIGKITAEFRGTANEFKETWQREVDLESEIKALDPNAIEAEAETVPRAETAEPAAPAVKEVDPSVFEDLKLNTDETADTVAETEARSPEVDANDKRNWL